MTHPLDSGELVTLTAGEGRVAKAKGLMRNQRAIEAGRANNHGLEGDGTKEDVLGAIGERVVAKYLGIPWDANADNFEMRHHGDVGSYEVRTTMHRNGRLLIAPSDNDDRVYILVTHERGWVFRIRGWMLGGDAKGFPLIELVEGRAQVHAVLASELRPMAELKDNKGGS